jgi:origin recognition complex subunit 5
MSSSDGHFNGTLQELTLVLSDYLADYSYGGKKFVLVLQDAEWFVKNKRNTIMMLALRLQELSKRNICVVLTSTLPWEKFLLKRNTVVPFVIRFPALTKDQSIAYIYNQLNLPYLRNAPEDVIRNLLSILLSTVSTFTRDVKELSVMAEIVLTDSQDTVKHLCEKSGKDLAKTSYNCVTQYLKKAVHLVHLQDVRKLDGYSSDVKSKYNIELPLFGKYMLIAGFIASYNSPKWDKM